MIYPTSTIQDGRFYIDAFKAYGSGKALLVTVTGETWMFDGSAWQNYGTWRNGDLNQSVDIDNIGNVWVCGRGGAAKRDAETGNWQRYRLTNTSQIDYFVEDFSLDSEGNAWFTGNAGTGVGGFQKFDGTNWTGFNEFTYGLGYPFPFQADNTQAIYRRPSNGNVVINPTFHGIHEWNGSSYNALEDLLTDSKGFAEDSQGRLWSLGEYFNLRYYDPIVPEWVSLPITGWGSKIITDPTLPGTIWALTDYEILRTDGNTSFSRSISDFPGSGAWFTGLALDHNGIVWTGTWSQFTSTGSTLIRLDANTGLYQTWSHDEGWPFPGEHVTPLAITPDGKLWLTYGSEYPSEVSGLCWFDGSNVGLFPSSPGGIPQWGGLPNSNIKDLQVRVIPGGYELWMSCMGRGIAVLTYTDGTTGVNLKQEIPSGFELAQNAPNPFSLTTTISFSIPSSEFCSLKIYDLHGIEVALLANELKVTGTHSITFDASGLKNGVYFYRLNAGQFTETKKLILLR